MATTLENLDRAQSDREPDRLEGTDAAGPQGAAGPGEDGPRASNRRSSSATGAASGQQAVERRQTDAPAASSEGDTEPDGAAEASPEADTEAIKAQVIELLKTIYDPEIPVDIYELGLIYRVDVQPDGFVEIDMTLTSPACPVAGSLPPEVEYKVGSCPLVNAVLLNVVWDPPWTPDMMTEAAKLELNMW
jgi:FeS assembly SUF system protein